MEITRVKGWSKAQWFVSALVNICGIHTQIFAVSTKDTDSIYALETKKKLSARKLQEVENVLKGLEYGWDAYN